MDIELIRELFKNCRRAAEILGTDAEFARRLDRPAKSACRTLQIGKRGQLQEWIEDYEETEPQRSTRFTPYSLYPGHDISLKTTPELAAAVKKSLECAGRRDRWSTVWRDSSLGPAAKPGTRL